MRHLLLALALLAACSRATTPPVEIAQDPAIGSMPIRTVAIVPATAAGSEIAPGAAAAVTELLTSAASRAGVWGLTEPSALRVSAAKEGESVAAYAGDVAAKAKVDAALTVELARFRERVGGDFGVSEPASVALRILLVPAGRKEPVWRASYSFTQEPLSYNLWNFWQVQRGGVKWLTAAEIARIGIDEAIGRLSGQPVPER
jgi:hypothetical protein